MLVGDIINLNAANWPDGVAVTSGGRRMTFAELGSRANRLANALGTMGDVGDRVAILARNVPEYVEALYGVPSAGMTLTMLNYRLNPKEWAAILTDAGARVLIVEHDFWAGAGDVISSVASIEHVLVIGAPAASNARSYEETLAAAPATAPQVSVGEEAIACLIYTSGTTGFPKGAMVSHRAIVGAALSYGLELGMSVGERVLMTFPMCHAAGFQVFVYHLRSAEIVVTPAFEPGEWLGLLEQHRITRTALAPTMARFVLDHPAWATADVSSVRSLSYGGMPMSLSMAQALSERFGALDTGFGQTETTLLVTFMGPEEHRRALASEPELLGSCGRPMSLAAVSIVDEDLTPVPPGDVGELCVRSSYSMSGYWGRDEATAEVMADGWLRTGDLARQDARGYVYIVDRMRDMVKTGGQNVYPREVELVLAEHPAVAEVAVLGLADSTWGENVGAAIVLRRDQTVTAEELIAHCVERLAGYKKPREIFFVDELPRNVTGKVLKRALRDRLVEHRVADARG